MPPDQSPTGARIPKDQMIGYLDQVPNFWRNVAFAIGEIQGGGTNAANDGCLLVLDHGKLVSEYAPAATTATGAGGGKRF